MGGIELDEQDSEREGEEFPRLHACSTIDRPLEPCTGPTARPQLEKRPFTFDIRVY